MNKIELRYASLKDAALLSGLQSRTFWETYGNSDHLDQEHITAYVAATFNLKTTESDIADRQTLYLLLEIDDEPAGLARLRLKSARPEIDAENPIEISRIYLIRKFWGKGFGAALLTRCLAEAEKRLCDVIWLSVWQYNDRAIAFYEKFGFQNAGTHIFDLAGSAQTDLIMRRRIGK